MTASSSRVVSEGLCVRESVGKGNVVGWFFPNKTFEAVPLAGHLGVIQREAEKVGAVVPREERDSVEDSYYRWAFRQGWVRAVGCGIEAMPIPSELLEYIQIYFIENSDFEEEGTFVVKLIVPHDDVEKWYERDILYIDFLNAKSWKGLYSKSRSFSASESASNIEGWRQKVLRELKAEAPRLRLESELILNKEVSGVWVVGSILSPEEFTEDSDVDIAVRVDIPGAEPGWDSELSELIAGKLVVGGSALDVGVVVNQDPQGGRKITEGFVSEDELVGWLLPNGKFIVANKMNHRLVAMKAYVELTARKGMDVAALRLVNTLDPKRVSWDDWMHVGLPEADYEKWKASGRNFFYDRAFEMGWIRCNGSVGIESFGWNDEKLRRAQKFYSDQPIEMDAGFVVDEVVGERTKSHYLPFIEFLDSHDWVALKQRAESFSKRYSESENTKGGPWVVEQGRIVNLRFDDLDLDPLQSEKLKLSFEETGVLGRRGERWMYVGPEGIRPSTRLEEVTLTKLPDGWESKVEVVEEDVESDLNKVLNRANRNVSSKKESEEGQEILLDNGLTLSMKGESVFFGRNEYDLRRPSHQEALVKALNIPSTPPESIQKEDTFTAAINPEPKTIPVMKFKRKKKYLKKRLPKVEAVATMKTKAVLVMHSREARVLETKPIWSALKAGGALVSVPFKMKVGGKEEELFEVTLDLTSKAWQTADHKIFFDEVGSVNKSLVNKIQEEDLTNTIPSQFDETSFKCGQCGKTAKMKDNVAPICDKCKIAMVPASSLEPVKGSEVQDGEKFNKDEKKEESVKEETKVAQFPTKQPSTAAPPSSEHLVQVKNVTQRGRCEGEFCVIRSYSKYDDGSVWATVVVGGRTREVPISQIQVSEKFGLPKENVSDPAMWKVGQKFKIGNHEYAVMGHGGDGVQRWTSYRMESWPEGQGTKRLDSELRSLETSHDLVLNEQEGDIRPPQKKPEHDRLERDVSFSQSLAKYQRSKDPRDWEEVKKRAAAVLGKGGPELDQMLGSYAKVEESVENWEIVDALYEREGEELIEKFEGRKQKYKGRTIREPTHLKTLAKEAGISVDKAMTLWGKAQVEVEKGYKDVEKKSDRYYALVTGVFKKMAGLGSEKKESVKSEEKKPITEDEQFASALSKAFSDKELNEILDRYEVTKQDKYIALAAERASRVTGLSAGKSRALVEEVLKEMGKNKRE